VVRIEGGVVTPISEKRRGCGEKALFGGENFDAVLKLEKTIHASI
jgi:hypothetical protein